MFHILYMCVSVGGLRAGTEGFLNPFGYYQPLHNRQQDEKCRLAGRTSSQLSAPLCKKKKQHTKRGRSGYSCFLYY